MLVRHLDLRLFHFHFGCFIKIKVVLNLVPTGPSISDFIFFFLPVHIDAYMGKNTDLEGQLIRAKVK